MKLTSILLATRRVEVPVDTELTLHVDYYANALTPEFLNRVGRLQLSTQAGLDIRDRVAAAQTSEEREQALDEYEKFGLEQMDGVYQMFGELISHWDIEEDDGTMVNPKDPAALRRIPLPILYAIQDAINGDAVPNEKRSTASKNGSRATVSTAKSRGGGRKSK